MALRDSLGLTQRRMASAMSSSGRARLRRRSTIKASSQSVRVVASRCGRVDRSSTWSRAFQRATVRLWMPSSRARALFEAMLFLDAGAGTRGCGGVGVPLEIDQRARPRLGWRRRCGSPGKTLAPVGPQAPPARGAAGLAVIAAPARGSLLWTTGTSCTCACISRSCTKRTACHSRAPSRQSSETKHESRGSVFEACGRAER